MAQYITYVEGQYNIVKGISETLKGRTGQRGGYFVTDIELIAGGFSGNENTGWKNLVIESFATTGNLFRDGIRAVSGTECYVIDAELTITGFTGSENIDWKCIKRIPVVDENILIILFGDSVSGGIALNNEATAGELAVRSRIQIWDNTSNTEFDDLEIGVNNLLGHTQLSVPYSTTRHGMELEIANLIYAQSIIHTVYLCKTGQGGSDSAEWKVNTTYNCVNTFAARVNGAIAAIGNAKPLKIYLIGSLGINNVLNATVATYYADMVTAIGVIRGVVGTDAKIIIIKEHYGGADAGIIADLATINTKITDLANNLSNVYRIDSGVIALVDDWHPSYAGYKTLVDNIFPKIIDNFKFGNKIISS